MPYVSVKTFPQDDEAQKRAAERIQQVLMEVWGCEPDWISVAVENVDPDRWEEEIVRGEMDRNGEHMLIRDGKKLW